MDSKACAGDIAAFATADKLLACKYHAIYVGWDLRSTLLKLASSQLQ